MNKWISIGRFVCYVFISLFIHVIYTVRYNMFYYGVLLYRIVIYLFVYSFIDYLEIFIMCITAMAVLFMRPANERRRSIVTLSLIGLTHTQNDPWQRSSQTWSDPPIRNHESIHFCNNVVRLYVIQKKMGNPLCCIYIKIIVVMFLLPLLRTLLCSCYIILIALLCNYCDYCCYFVSHTIYRVKYAYGMLCSVFCFLFSCDQAALQMVFSVCPPVRLSVRLSVTPFWLCFHHRIITKFSGVITNDQCKVHAKGQGQRSKVKVTTQLNPFRTVTPVWIDIWWWNDAYSLMLLRRGALLFFKVIRQISRSHSSKNRRIWPRLGVSGL